jgi:protein TonB
MSYADQSAMSPRKIVAIALVGLLHALLGYAFITGLAYNVVKKTLLDTKVFDVAEEPPPPEEKPPPPPPETKIEPPPMVAPPPIVSAPTVSAPPMTTVTEAPRPVITPTAPPAPPPPPKPALQSKAVERGDSASWVTTEDYPSRALREEREGTTAVAWDVDAEGKVVNCHVTSSSGSPDLDEASCKNITRRGRYKPALDANGQPTASSGFSRRVRWQIPKD